MKKQIFLMILVAYGATLAAQGYVRVDTVYKPYYDFDYEEWLSSDPDHALQLNYGKVSIGNYNIIGSRTRPVEGERLEYNYIDGEVNVYGITIIGKPSIGMGGVDYPPFDYPFIPSEYLMLYDATPDSLILKKQVLFDHLDTHAFRGEEYLPDRWSMGVFLCDADMVTRSTGGGLYRWDFFFDKPVQVSDSFYVGLTQHLEILELTWPEEPVPLYDRFCAGIYTTDGMASGRIIYDSSCWMPLRNCKLRLTRSYDSIAASLLGLRMNEWVNFGSHEFFLCLPIIRVFDTIWAVDTPACLPVQDFSIMSRFGDTVILRWLPPEERNEFQVSYGPEGFDPDSGTFVLVTANRWRYIDTLRTGQVMEARVRTVCRELDTLRYSEWSEAVYWQTRNAGVNAPKLVDDIKIAPNPATDKVVVSSEMHLIEGIDVYNSVGKWYGAWQPHSHQAVFSVKNWPAGAYVVVVFTEHGDIKKRFVVE